TGPDGSPRSTELRVLRCEPPVECKTGCASVEYAEILWNAADSAGPRSMSPVIGMGTWQTFDTREDRTRIVDEALAAGTNLFDSSPMYGRAEDTLAKALDGRRAQAMIATKIWTGSASEGRAQAAHALQLFGRVEI